MKHITKIIVGLALGAALALWLAGCKEEAPKPQVLWPESWNKSTPAIMIEEVDFDAKMCRVNQRAEIIAVECRRTLQPGGLSTTDGRMIMPPGACGVGDDGNGHVIHSSDCGDNPHGGMEP